MTYETFEGQRVGGKTIKVRACEFPTDETKHHGTEFYVLQRVTTDDIQHPMKDDLLIRRQVGGVEQSWIIPQLTAARMIDGLEPAKLPGTTREDMTVEAPTLDLAVNEDGSVTFVDTFSGESYTAPPDDETSAGRTVIDGVTIDSETGEVLAEAGSGAPGAHPGAVEAHDGKAAEATDVAPNPAGEDGHRQPTVDARPSTSTQRINLSKQIAGFDERLSGEFVTWCKHRRCPVEPARMTFDEANAALRYVGDVHSVET